MPREYTFCPLCSASLHVKDGRLRCTQCEFVHFNNPTPVVCAIVQVDDSVILVRNRGWPEKMFGLVSGFLEAQETPQQGCLREIKEELGLDGTVESLIGVYSFEFRNEVLLAFHVKASGDIVLSDEIHEYKRVPIAKLKPWDFGTGQAVKDWMQQIPSTQLR
jgi:NAD+ diphosphatase